MEREGIYKHISDASEGVVNVRKYKPEQDKAKTKSPEFGLEQFPETMPIPPLNVQTTIEQELNGVILEILATVKETLQAKTVAFCWSSHSKRSFYMATNVTDSPDFTKNKWLPFAGDVLTQIFLARNAQLYTDISQLDEAKIIRYYEAPNGIRSFMGVPVFHKEMVYGILFTDSIAKNAFGPDDVKLLNRFGKICSALIDNFAAKSSHLESVRFVEPSIRFMHELQEHAAIDEIIEKFCLAIKESLDFDHLTVSLFNPKSELVIRKVNSKGSYISEGSKVDLNHSALGVSLMRGQDGTIDDLSSLNGMPRFYPGEPCPEGDKPQGSMLIVPIKFKDFYAGAITLETVQKRYFGRENFAKVRAFVEALAFSLHTKFLEDRLKLVTPFDDETGTLSRRTFIARIRHEINRATREQTGLALLMVGFDDENGLKNRYGDKGIATMMRTTARLISGNIRNFDLICRFDKLKFAVCLVNISEVNARYWADKVRELILNSPIETDEEFKSILATASIGIANIRHEKPDIDLLFDGANTALQHAMNSGGNTVKIF
ncbi:MAG: diguanylate cyclase [Chlorobiales bacterium]|nr:diguanylate cyclase [Chlorobiales bacterium]